MSEKTDECVTPESNTTDVYVQIKEEPKENDIKDYAENTMNELLGWYGYDKVNSTDTEHLNLEKYTSGDKDGQLSDDISNDGTFDSDDNESENSEISKLSRSDSQNSLAAQHRNLVTALTKKHKLTGAPEGTLPSEKIVCAWCQKSGPKHFTLKTSSGSKAFCSEVCFTQCRRASFKKNKVCDWCKHVRHTVNYVDFQDGEQQLQFCSAKCLNQYKMSIFCKETQEHLKQIRSPSETKKTKSDNDEQILITPELWLKEGRVVEKETKLHYNEKETTIKNKRTKIEKQDNELLIRDKPAVSKSYPEKMSRDKVRRFIHKENKVSTPIPSALQESQNVSTTTLSQGNMPALTQLFQPQLLNMFAPGMSQLGGIHPWFYPGFMPPGFLPQSFPVDGMQRSPNEANFVNVHQSPVSPVISEDSIPDMHDGRKNKSINGSRQRPPTVHSKQNDSASKSVPVCTDFGSFSSMFGSSQQTSRNQHGSGIPPVTMIMPIPIALPFPVPIPLPLPLSMEKIMEVFNKTKCNENNTKNNVNAFKNHVKQEKEQNNLNMSLSSDGLDSSVCSSGYRHLPSKSKNDINENETIPAGRLSCNSCITEHSISPYSGSEGSSPHYDSRLSASYDFSLLRKRTLSPDGSLDLTKKSRMTIALSNSSNSCDGAIDLSKDSNVGKSHDGKENRDTNDTSSVLSDHELHNGDVKEPKIHIVTPRDEPPLSQQLPLPPVDHKYSNRRGLILDAPYNPRRSRSPSPERRPYIARDYRGDRGRRRLLGIRNIKTK